MQWRKRYGDGLTYKEVLIEARKSYTPVKKGSGFKIIPKSIMKPIRDTDRFVRENIKQPLRKTFEPNFMTGKEKQEAKRIWDQQQRQAIKQRDLPKLDSALAYIGVSRMDNFDTIYATYLSRVEADPDDQNLKQSMGIITSYIISTMPVFESDSRKKKSKKGGALTAHELKKVLNSSYEANPTDATRNLKVDKELSGKRTKVFHDADTGQTVVAHRGTASIQDVGTDLGLALGFRGKRFAHAKKVQKQAEKKYGTNQLETVGHSLGGIVAEEVGGNSKNVITFNKAVVNPNRRNLKNQTDVKTSDDPVSVLNRFSSNKAHVIPSQKFNPLNPFKEHTVTTLKRAKKDKQYGR